MATRRNQRCSKVKLTVIVCTYNRSRSLEKLLRSLIAITLPADVEWEVLIVDNNSSDDTRDVVRSFCDQCPGLFRYVFEPNSGKSHALNTGIRKSNADILAFADDDVIVEPSWLQNLTANLRDDKWAGAGGRILGHWTFPPPRSLS